MSFRLKTILGIALIETLLLGILIVSGIGFLRSSNEEQLIQRSRSLASFFASASTNAVITTDLASLESGLKAILTSPGVIYARVRGHGMVLAEGGDPVALARPFQEDIQLQAEDPVFDAKAEIRAGTQTIGRVEMGFSTDGIARVLADAKRWTSVIAALEVALVALFSYVLGTVLTRQLHRLEVAAEEVAHSGPGVQIPVRGRDEVARVSQSFNRMSQRLAESYRQLRTTLEESHTLARAAARGEAKNAATLAASLDAIVTVDSEGRIVEFNGNAERVFGYSAQEAIGASMSELLIPPAYRAAHQKGMERYLATGAGRVLNQRIVLSALHKDGHSFPVELNISPIKTEDSLLFTSFMRDITDRQRVEQELKLAAQALEADEAICITDREGRILRINAAFTRITGYSAAEALGQSTRILSSGRHDRDFYQAMWRNIAQEGRWRGEIYNKRKDGSIYPQSLSITAVENDQGEATNYVAHFVDITERKRNEETLKNARRQAEAASEAKSRFLATMSHEIRTPLNAIINMNNLLLESSLDAEQRQFATAAVNGGQLLLALLNNVLDFSKIEAGKLTLERQWLRGMETVNTVASLFSAEAQSKGIEIVVVSSPGMPAEYFGDLLRTKQILTNLVGNAIKFTDRGGVCIRLDYRTAQDGRDGRLLIEVEDSGIGISEAQQRALFQEFVQADDSPTRRHQGSGLGLAISLRLAELMGGQIRCESRQGAGARFSAELPMPGRGQHDADLAEPLEHLRKSSALVYSRSTVLREGLVEQLGRYGIPSQGFDRAPALQVALERIDAESQTLVLLDTPAGSADDSELDYIKALPHRYPSLRFVRLAPVGEVGAIDASKRLGFRSVVRKPARLHSMLVYLAEALDAPSSQTGGASSATSEADMAQARSEERPARILLVEDSPSNVAVATSILQKAHYEVVVAWSGEEAVELTREATFDLILMDISMPIMDGLEATRRIRQGGSPNRETPIVAMTANAFAEDRERCFDAGMDDFISKPIDIGNLRRTIASWLGKRRDSRAADHKTQAAGVVTRPTATAQHAFDPTYLDRLAESTSPELLPELAELFLDEASKRLSTLGEHHSRSDLQALQADAHSLKSGCGSFGLLRLQGLAEQIEKAARGQDTQRIDAIMRSFPGLAKTDLSALRAEIGRRQGGAAASPATEDRAES